MFFGTRDLVNKKGEVVKSVCPRCQRETMMQGKSFRRWFTLFFVPILPISSRHTFSECSNCRAQFRTSPQELGEQMAESQQQLLQQSIQMYNSLRTNPANSVTLNNLLLLYLQLGEFEQAISAGNEFKQALSASEQCMTTLARVYMEQKRYPEAVQWLDAALMSNPMSGEAAYCKAVSLMTQAPPDLSGATAAARIARTAGLQGADALIHEIETRSRAN